MEEFSWTDRVKNEKMLHRVEEKRNILQTIKRMNASWIGHILGRNCLLKHIIEEEARKGTQQFFNYRKEKKRI